MTATDNQSNTPPDVAGLCERLRAPAHEYPQGALHEATVVTDMAEAATIDRLTAERDNALNNLDLTTDLYEKARGVGKAYEARVAEMKADNFRQETVIEQLNADLIAVEEKYRNAEARVAELEGLIEIIENLDPKVVDDARAALNGNKP